MNLRMIAACLVATGLAIGSAGAEEGGGKLRYTLAPGREWTYRSTVGLEGAPMRYEVNWKVWAIGREPDGSWRLVIRCDMAARRTAPDGRGAPSRSESLVWRCRMFEDGALVGVHAMGTARDPSRLFPRLPENADERNRGWTSAGDAETSTTHHHRVAPGAPADGDVLTIVTRSECPQDRVFVASHECLATFDARRGAVTRIETRDDSEYLQQHSRGVTELVGIEDRGGDWAASFGREADAYFAATEAYDAAHQRATRDAGRSQSLMEGAKAGLEQARRGLDAEIFRGQIDRKLSDHAETAKYAAEEAASRASRIGAAAPEWEAADLDGKVRRLADYRGKVVVLDFWYRGCGWCMHAMPQVARLAETFRDRPVAVLGVSTDKDEKDARAVAKAMGLMHPTIRAGDVDSRYGVESFPTLIVIDKAGKIREFRVGYSPHLYEDLEPLIRELAAERPAG